MKNCKYTMGGKNSKFVQCAETTKQTFYFALYYKNFCELRWYIFCYEKKHCVNFIGPGCIEPELANLSPGFKSNLDFSPPPSPPPSPIEALF
jgi:hypothetical protein